MQQADVKDVQHAWSKAGNDYLAIAEANWGHWLDAFLMYVCIIRPCLR